MPWNDELHRMYSTNSQIRFKTTVLRSSLCDYSDVYIFVKGTVTLIGQGSDVLATQADRNNKQVFKNFAMFTE